MPCVTELNSIEIFERDNYLKRIEKIGRLLSRESSQKWHPKLLRRNRFSAFGAIEVPSAVCLEYVRNIPFIMEFSCGLSIYIFSWVPPCAVAEQEFKNGNSSNKSCVNWIKVWDNNCHDSFILLLKRYLTGNASSFYGNYFFYFNNYKHQ